MLFEQQNPLRLSVQSPFAAYIEHITLALSVIPTNYVVSNPYK